MLPKAVEDRITQEILGLDTLEARHSDALDFHEVSVWQLRKALQMAYEAGSQAKP